MKLGIEAFMRKKLYLGLPYIPFQTNCYTWLQQLTKTSSNFSCKALVDEKARKQFISTGNILKQGFDRG